MNADLQRSLQRTCRRLFLQTFGRWWVRCLCLGFLAFTLTLFILGQGHLSASSRSIFDNAFQQHFIWLAVVFASSLICAFIIALLKRPSLQQAGLTLDRHFELKERFTTALHLSEEQRQSDFGLAFHEEIIEHTTNLNVEQAVPLAPSKHSAWIPLCLCLALLSMFFCEAPKPVNSSEPAPLVMTKKEKDALQNKLKQLQKQAKQAKTKEKELPHQDIQDIDEIIEKLGDKVPENKKDAEDMLKEMTELADRLRKRSKEMEKQQEAFGEQFQQVDRLTRKKKTQGPANNMKEALDQGDLERAQDEARRLSRKMQDDGLSDEQRQQLAKQLKEMQEQLDQLLDREKQEEQLQRLADAGQIDAEQLQRELEQMKKNLEQLKKMDPEQLKQLAEALKKAEEAMKNGQQGEAAQAMKKAGDKLGQLGKGDQQAQIAQQMRLLRQAGRMLGKGIGRGKRPQGKDEETSSTEEWVSGRKEKGKYTGFRWVPGMGVRTPNTPKERQAVINEAGREAAEAVERQYLPRSAQDIARGYFEGLRQPKNK